jgi:putative tryptophan/tyrosine transport system substrate-binding protein
MGGSAARRTRREFLRCGLAIAGLGLLAGCGLVSPPSKPPRVARVGYLCTNCSPSFRGPAPPGTITAAFTESLRELGHIEGENVIIEYRGADGLNERLPELAAELVGRQVDIIVTGGATPAALAAKAATSTIPIVFVAVGDPIANGLVASYARPGGNLTGTTNLSPETVAKRLQLLKDVLPAATRVAVVWNFGNPVAAAEWDEMQPATGPLGLTLERRDLRGPDQIEEVFGALAGARPDALLVAGEPFMFANRARLAELAAGLGVPAMYTAREFVEAGGLMCYGVNIREQFRRAAAQVDKILKGASPAELPVERPTKFDFAINLRTAQALGLTIPQSVLQQATEVIQ